MTRLSVNINKIALVRNSRNNGIPDLLQFAAWCESFGADGITVHPRPDERHIRYADVSALKSVVTTELNVEGYPDDKFMNLVLETTPHQVTLVPDLPGQLTSDHGWDTVENQHFLSRIIARLKDKGIRVSLFVDPINDLIEAAKVSGADCIELYTEPFVANFETNRDGAVAAFQSASAFASSIDLIVNAGHDLNLSNLQFFKNSLPRLDEVSIGHALVTDAWIYGLENTIQMYKRLLI